MSLFIFSLIFAALGLGIAVAVSWIMIEPIFNLFRGKKAGFQTKPSRKTNSKLKKADRLIEKGRFDDALKVLRKGFLLHKVSREEHIVELKEHNEGVLSRVLLVAQEKGSRADNIGDVEHLLMARVELLELLVRAGDSFRNLRSRREKAGKDFPSWSRSDFESRIKEIKAELELNEKHIKEQLAKLFDAVKNQDKEEKPVTYH